MSDFSDLRQQSETATESLRQLDEQQIKCSQDMSRFLSVAEDNVRRMQEELLENLTEYQRIAGEHEHVKLLLLHTLESTALRSSDRDHLSDLVGRLDLAGNGWEPADTVTDGLSDLDPVPVENLAPSDPARIRRGMGQVLRKGRNGASKPAEAEELAT